jgi:hypothetical protein
MKKVTLVLIISLISFQLSYAQKLKGNKNVILETRETSDFSEILIKDKLKVFLTESTYNTISVETDENLQIAVETKVINGILEVYLTHEISRKKALNIYIGVNDSIKRIEAQDYATISNDNQIYISDTQIIAKDHATINLNLKADYLTIKGDDKSDYTLTLSVLESLNISLEQKASVELESIVNKAIISLSDNSSIDIKGNGESLTLNAEGNTDFKGKEFITNQADVFVKDKSSSSINPLEEININSEDNASIDLYANPKIYINKFSDKSTLYKK